MHMVERSQDDNRPRGGLTLRVVMGFCLTTLLWLVTWSSSQTSTAPLPATPALLVAESADYGQYVTDSDGRALYIFLNDTAGASACADNCLLNWPPVLVASPQALPELQGAMDAALLGTLDRADGTVQLTFNGWPLYYFVADTEAGATLGQAQGDVWYLLSPQGTGVGLNADELGGGAAP